MLAKILKSRTLIVMTALAVLPALELLGKIDLVAILQPLACGIDAADSCKEGLMKLAAAYALVITSAGKVLRFITTSPLFTDAAAGKERGEIGLVMLLFVFLAGLAGNGYLAAEAGKPVESVADVKTAVVAAYDGRVADYSRLNQ